jgi:hypothetical protein
MTKNTESNYFGTERDGSLTVGNVVVLSPCAEFSREDIARLVACANFCAGVQKLSDSRSRLTRDAEIKEAFARVRECLR